MPLSETLLTPIPGTKPSGENIRYAPIFDKIKEARRKEETIAQGDWQRQLKEADYRLVIKLATETLATKSKDLQVAAWLTEALTYQQGLPGLLDGLSLLHSLVDQFWETVYPEAEDGDLELRVAPLNWVGDYKDLQRAVRSVPLTKGGLDWFKYKESRAVGYEADCTDSPPRLEARNQAVSEGKLTAEEFDDDFGVTPKAHYQKMVADAETALEILKTLDETCEGKFGDVAPSFRILRTAIEEVEHATKMLLVRKRETEPDPEAETVPDEASDETAFIETSEGESPAVGDTAGTRVRAKKALAVEPEDRDDAVRRVVASALYLRTADPNDPVPYLLLRSIRWGELRAQGDSVGQELLDAPPTEMRQQLKRAAMDGDWERVRETAETAMAMPCGRGWLDLQRYVVRACTELGSTNTAAAICSELRILLAQFPALPEMTLMDDTPTANSETQAWLKEMLPNGHVSEERASQPAPVVEIPSEQGAEVAVPDAYQLAREALLYQRDPEAAIRILTREIVRERSGRGRFLRRLQLAQICIECGRDPIARAILDELGREIDSRKLEDWEEPETIAQALVLLFRYMEKERGDDSEKKKIYAQICRLDPMQASRLSG